MGNPNAVLHAPASCFRYSDSYQLALRLIGSGDVDSLQAVVQLDEVS